jgi:hypothetical protein
MKKDQVSKDITKPLKEQINKQRPNEQCGFYFSSSIKITDPKTGEVLVRMRCD